MLPIGDIINKYTIATSKKAKVRQMRVSLLRDVQAGRTMQISKASRGASGPALFGGNAFLLAKKGLKKVG